VSDHIDTCSRKNYQPCPAPNSLRGEPVGEHWWSGFPGAYCLKCGAANVDEECVGSGCECPCHDEFWAGYEQAMREES
jgi:hypothetical protein